MSDIKRKSQIHEFFPEIYPRKLWVAFGNLEKILERFKSDGEPINKATFASKANFDGVAFGEVTIDDKNDLGMLICFHNKNLKTKLITHESIHFANYLSDILGLEHGDEALAYIGEWCAGCVEKARKYKGVVS